ncbi:hypothetical protein E4K72_20670 [Oxalobacteraceae bacterium OM1]|nr:hypothetical protein E4K72_20670 [Oxalobacteraceae bacterium OM1]
MSLLCNTALRRLLETEFALVSEPVERGSSTTYFHRTVCWHPARSTRVLRVHRDARGEPVSMQLCVSSDNNNSVLLKSPLSETTVRQHVATEIAMLALRHG